MAINLKDLYDVYYGDVAYLSPVKNNTPFEYYTNDPEFVRDARNACRFVAQRLGAGLGLSSMNISDLTVYAAYEEAVTTYGNLVYQYKIRDNYINMEGSKTLPFSNNTTTYVNSLDIGSPVTWSAASVATWDMIDRNTAYSQSIVDGEIYVISSSVKDYIAPDTLHLKSFTLATQYVDPVYNVTLDLSQYVYNQFNKIGGARSGSYISSGNQYVYFFTTSPSIAGGSSTFNVTGSIPTVYIQNNIEPALNDRLLNNNLSATLRIADDYGGEAGVGGSFDVQKGMLEMSPGVQDYDLNAWAKASASLDPGDSIEVRRVFYQEPPAIVRYFDPYAGTGTGIQSLLETFGFGQFSPGINFLLMPIFFDVMKIQAIEFNDQIRKSAYSFDLVNNKLRIFPIPTQQTALFFEYVKKSDKNAVATDTRENVITDIMNVPYRNPIYMNINTVGRMWIAKYTLALCREIEAHLRIQYSSMTIQGVGPINGSELITDARTEKEALITELKEMLNEVSRKSQLERKQIENGFLRDTLTQIPLPIYIM
jgi:hypothetical protein